MGPQLSPLLKCRASWPGASSTCQQIHQVSSTFARSFAVSHSPYYPRAAPREKEARGNKLRGMSAIKGGGVQPWIRLSVTKDDLETPRRIKHVFKPNESHGLWKFFNGARTILTDPYELKKHGRAWSREELRHKSFGDLHTLWWRCQWEQNKILTEKWTRKVKKVGFGDSEAAGRMKEVRRTMFQIRGVLTERWYAWEDARKLAITRAEPDILPKDQLIYGNQDL